ncbi:hypothetical protein AX17_004075 [Amanita inopinata Kibby_2008]|nr:hypothetical protein AX17_004075 [Amanita inopinata Kibby_2008]
MSSQIPVRRGSRTTRTTAKNAENATARVTRATARAKTSATTSGTTLACEPPTTRQPTATANKGKAVSTENATATAGVKTRRGALIEVTKLVTNNNVTKNKATSTVKGKEKETAVAPAKAKPVLVDVRKPLHETTRAAARRVTRASASTTATTSKPVRQVKKPVVSKGHKEPPVQILEKSQPIAPLPVEPAPSSSLRKRPSHLDDHPDEPPRVFKRQHTEKVEEVKPPRDDSQAEVDKVAADLVQLDTDASPEPTASQWTDLDADDWDDPLMASEYVAGICNYWREIEVKSLPEPEYMNLQREINWQHRSILIDWLIETHYRFQFLQETLFSCINLLDRFLSVRVISLSKLQLVGIVCLLIACKYEETCSPSVEELAMLIDDQYKPDDIIRAERYVLKALDWDLSFPGPLGWLRRGSKADNFEERARTIAKYLMEAGCMERKLVGTPPSLLAAASLWLSRLIVGREDWTPNLAHYMTYTEQELIPTVNHLLNYLLQPTQCEMLYRKYAARRYLKCSVYIKGWVRERWHEGAEILLVKHLEWLKAEARSLGETESREA